MTPLVPLVVGSAAWARDTEPDPDPEFIVFKGGLGFLADEGVHIMLATDPEWPPFAILAFGEDGSVVEL